MTSAAAITGLAIVAPSVVGVNEPFAVGVRVLTKPFYAPFEVSWFRQPPSVGGPFNLSPRGIRYMDNVPATWTGQLVGPVSLAFNNERPIRRVDGFSFATPGIQFIHFRDPVTGIEGVSNPISVEAQPAERLFWGDLHTHTIFTDAIRCPEDIYAFARNEAFLDICALSDHSEMITDAQWEYFLTVTKQFHEPGRFVTLAGGEWTSMEYGHRNYYYRGDRGPILRCTNPATKTLKDFHATVRRQDALVIPHHSANTTMGVDWSKGYDPVGERLVEIHSAWGNSERPAAEGNPLPIQFCDGEKAGQHVIDALARGYRFGFIGGGDIHDGRPGDDLTGHQDKPEDYYLARPQGLVGVWAKELTREAVFDALWNRCVYATTSRRTWLKFSINGHAMGQEFAATGDLSVHVEAASDSPIAQVDLVCNGADIEVLTPQQRTVLWQTRAPAKAGWYYVRVTRHDGHLAWSSPIWIV